ncbi:unnamed protein product [Orchesella dallaii]|uniref:Odorant receptor n=1 Tax=Orchesella dallaii TaxID=48710 RepID=A0ABP1RSI9_9HEXA
MIYFTGSSYLDWDDANDCIIPANNYLRWNAELLFRNGLFFPVIMTANLIMTAYNGDQMKSLLSFGVYLIGWVENVLIFSILCATHRFCKYNSNTIRMLNEVFRYSERMEKFLQEQNTQLNRQQILTIRKAETLVVIAAVLSFFVPIGFAGCVLHPLEPSHIMIQEWLEVTVSLKWIFIPFLLLVTAVISKAAVTVFNGIIFAFCYILLATMCITSLTPERVMTVVQPNADASQKAMIRYNVVTKCYGTLDDITVVKMYRTQQVLNVLINEIYASVLFSIHHVATLVVFVGLGLTLLKCPGEMLINSGPLIFLILVAGPAIPPFIEYWEAYEISEITDTSNAFITKCNKMLSRRSMLRKTVMSCRRLTLEAAYPFFTMTKHTFLEFVYYGIDLMITIVTGLPDLPFK